MASLKRVPLPDVPPGYRPTRKSHDPHEALRDMLTGSAVSWSPGDELTGLAMVATFLDDLIAETVAKLRADGAPWSEIAASLRVSRQAAQQRYGARILDATDEAPEGDCRVWPTMDIGIEGADDWRAVRAKAAEATRKDS